MGLSEIRARMDKACAAAGRAPEDVELIAVSKVQPEDRVAAVLDQGHRVFGENRVQEPAAGPRCKSAIPASSCTS